MLCELHTLILKVLNSNGHTVVPARIAKNIRRIAPHFIPGREEDSHEFLRYVLTALQKAFLKKYVGMKLPKEIENTTFIDCVYTGTLVSKITCRECYYESRTYDPFMDLSLEIKYSTTLDSAISWFQRVEVLDNDNKFKCPKCKALVRANKQFQIHEAPPILTIHLKRFLYVGRLYQKIDKPLAFSQNLNLELANGKCVHYSLFSVLVHKGGSAHSGHYYSFVKAANSVWYCMNDDLVQQVSADTVTKQSAYLLFYAADPGYFTSPEIPKKSVETPESEPVGTPPRKKARVDTSSQKLSSVNKVQQSPPTPVVKLETESPTTPTTGDIPSNAPQVELSPDLPPLSKLGTSEIHLSEMDSIATQEQPSKTTVRFHLRPSLKIQAQKLNEMDESQKIAVNQHLTRKTDATSLYTHNVGEWAENQQLHEQRKESLWRQAKEANEKKIGYQADWWDQSIDLPRIPRHKRESVARPEVRAPTWAQRWSSEKRHEVRREAAGRTATSGGPPEASWYYQRDSNPRKQSKRASRLVPQQGIPTSARGKKLPMKRFNKRR